MICDVAAVGQWGRSSILCRGLRNAPNVVPATLRPRAGFPRDSRFVRIRPIPACAGKVTQRGLLTDDTGHTSREAVRPPPDPRAVPRRPRPALLAVPDPLRGTRETSRIPRQRAAADHTIVLFTHRDWKEPVEFVHHCNTKWGTFLMGLKSLVETGEGALAPRDVQLSD